MSKGTTKEKGIIALAYFHRYGWIAVMLGCIIIWPTLTPHILCIGCIIFSIWSFIGYKYKWKHIYCSHQNASRQRMTPNAIYWDKIEKGEAYGIPAVILAFGLMWLVMILVH